jgi:AraC-like DNA-binding protein
MNFPTRLFLLFLSLCLSTVAQSQEDTLASKSYLEVRKLINATSKTDSTKAIQLAAYLLDRAEAANDKEEISNSKLGLGFIHGIVGKLEEGLPYFEAIIDEAQQDGNKDLEMKAHMLKGYMYNKQGSFSKAITPYYTGADIALEIKDYANYFSIINNIGWIKGSLEDYLGAVDIMKEGLNELSKESMVLTDSTVSKRELQMSLLTNIGKSYENANQADSSIFYVEKAIALAKPIEDSCYLKVMHVVRSQAFILKSEFVKAKQDSDVYSSICLPMNKTDSLVLSGNLGKIYYGTKKYQKAVDVLNLGLKVYNVPLEEEKYMDDYYKVMAKAHKSLGQLDSANYYFEKHINTTSEFGKLRTDLSTSFKNQEIDSFQKELDALAQEKAQKESLILYGGIAGGVVIIFLILGLLQSNKHRKENELKFKSLFDKVNAVNAPEAQVVNTKDTLLEERGSSEVNEETTQMILDGLTKLEAQHYYLHPACSAHNVAKRIKTNTTYLSKVINAAFEKNFSTYINDLRVNYAILKLKEDSKFRGYTIQAIATELGYKSADSFTKYFKQHTGLNPSFYIKKLNQIAA